MQESPEANKVIDQLREIIEGYYKRVKGKIATRADVKKEIDQMIKRRLG